MAHSATATHALVLSVVAALAAPVQAGPITFNSAITLSSDEFVVREQLVYDRARDDPGGAGREREALGVVSVLGYGGDEKVSLVAVLPYFAKRLELAGGARDEGGIGDVRAFARYTVVRKNWTARALRLSVFAGVEAPTGDDDVTDAQGRLPASVQPGSGSWDPFAGLVATYQTLAFQIDGQLAYQANTAANGFEAGNLARADASLQYRLWPRKLGDGLPGFLYGVVEANLIHKARNQVGGFENRNSGGLTLFLVPGLQYVTRRWIVEAAVQLPVVQNLGGTALETDFVVRAGFRFNF